jgi:hypothetical protein
VLKLWEAVSTRVAASHRDKGKRGQKQTMSDYYHEAIYIKSDNRPKLIEAIKYEVWGRLVHPETVSPSRYHLYLSEPIGGWMQLYYHRPVVHDSAVNSADKVLDYAWRAFKFEEAAVRVFEDEADAYSIHFSVGGWEFASIDKPSMRKGSSLILTDEIEEEWQNHPFTQKVVKLINRYTVLEKAILLNPPKVNMITWNRKKYGDPPKEPVDINRHVFLKGFEEWETADFEAARITRAKQNHPRERNQKNLEHLGRTSEKIMYVPYYWEAEENIPKGK